MEYGAVPKKAETTFENDKVIVQTVTMWTIEDVESYTKACLSYGARIVDTFRNIVIVEYKKDSDGKIGIIS
jgi:hypothetical protein